MKQFLEKLKKKQDLSFEESKSAFNILMNGEANESEIFDFKAAPNGYFMLKISWQYEWKNFNGSITVNNVLNTSYRDYLNEMRYFADAPGRNIFFNLNYKFKSSKSK